jgi:hypothetical protein
MRRSLILLFLLVLPFLTFASGDDKKKKKTLTEQVEKDSRGGENDPPIQPDPKRTQKAKPKNEADR